MLIKTTTAHRHRPVSLPLDQTLCRGSKGSLRARCTVFMVVSNIRKVVNFPREVKYGFTNKYFHILFWNMNWPIPLLLSKILQGLHRKKHVFGVLATCGESSHFSGPQFSLQKRQMKRSLMFLASGILFHLLENRQMQQKY